MARFAVLLLITSLAALLQCVVDASLAFDVTRVTQLNNSPTRTLHARRNPPFAAFPRDMDLRGGALHYSGEEEHPNYLYTFDLYAFGYLVGRLTTRLIKKVFVEMIPMAIAVGIGTYFGIRLANYHDAGHYVTTNYYMATAVGIGIYFGILLAYYLAREYYGTTNYYRS